MNQQDHNNSRWESVAYWPRGTCGNGDISTDTHDTREAAEAVCRMLERNGFGGCMQIFPTRTEVRQNLGLKEAASDDVKAREPLFTYAKAMEEALFGDEDGLGCVTIQIFTDGARRFQVECGGNDVATIDLNGDAVFHQGYTGNDSYVSKRLREFLDRFPVINALSSHVTKSADASGVSSGDLRKHVESCPQCKGPDDGCEEGQALEELALHPPSASVVEHALCETCGADRNTTRCPDCGSFRMPASASVEHVEQEEKVGGNFYNGIEWLACWLLDHTEGETITEEQLRPWAVAAWNEHLKRQTLGKPGASHANTVPGQMKYSVVGDHPILARPDKHGLTFNEAVSYSAKLVKAGFDGVTIREQSPSVLNGTEKQPADQASRNPSEHRIDRPTVEGLWDYLNYQFPTTRGNITLREFCDRLAKLEDPRINPAPTPSPSSIVEQEKIIKSAVTDFRLYCARKGNLLHMHAEHELARVIRASIERAVKQAGQ